VLGKNRFEWIPLENITRKDENADRDYLLVQIAPNSVVRTLSIVKAAINTAINEHDLDFKNLFAGIRVKRSGASKTDMLPITEEQIEGASQDFLNDPLAAALFVTLRDTGCRVAEVTGLLVRDIDLKQQTLTIKSNDHRSLKTATSERTIPISNEAAQHLAGFCTNKKPPEPLFTKYARPRGNDSASAMLMKRLRKTVNDPHVTIHSLRHRMKTGSVIQAVLRPYRKPFLATVRTASLQTTVQAMPSRSCGNTWKRLGCDFTKISLLGVFL
jgi:integrase